MKKLGILFLAAGALSLGACTETVEEETIVEIFTYSLDAENSTIIWGASMSPEYGHKGTVGFKSGSITMENGILTEGSFVVDMTTIKNTDQPEEKAMNLEGHLKGTIVTEDHPQDGFFNTPEFPTVDVTLGEYKDGNLSVTLTILGTELTQDVAVTISSDENDASIKGVFSIDFGSVGIPGLAPSEHGSISPKFDFDLNIMLTK